MKLVLALAILLIGSGSAYADWGLYSAASYCSPAKGIFVLDGVIETSGRDQLKAGKGFHRLYDGEHNLKCAIDKVIVEIHLKIYPPDTGECEGGGWVQLDKLSVGSTTVLSNTNFNRHCTGWGDDGNLVSIRVRNSKLGPLVELCRVPEGKEPTDLTTWQCEATAVKKWPREEP